MKSVEISIILTINKLKDRDTPGSPGPDTGTPGKNTGKHTTSRYGKESKEEHDKPLTPFHISPNTIQYIHRHTISTEIHTTTTTNPVQFA